MVICRQTGRPCLSSVPRAEPGGRSGAEYRPRCAAGTRGIWRAFQLAWTAPSFSRVWYADVARSSPTSSLSVAVALLTASAERRPVAEDANGDQGEVASCGSPDRGGDEREQPGCRGEPEPPSEQGAGGCGQETE